MDTKSHEKEQAGCPLCSGTTVMRTQLPHTDVRKCANRRCNLRFAFPQLDEEQLRAAYSHLYYPDADGRRAPHYAAGLKARLLPHCWDNYLNPKHFYYFASTSLRLAFERAGFQKIVLWYFTIRYPHHSGPRSTFHHMLLRAGLDGELLFTGRPRPSEVDSK